MPILMPYFKLAYFPVPKVACTSLKHTIFEINNGFFLRKVRDKMGRTVAGPKGKRYPIHMVYKTEEYSRSKHESLEGYTTFAVIRDPMNRVLSAYSNRVLHHKALEKPDVIATLEKKGLPLNPDVNQFVMELDAYRSVSKQVFAHTRPLSMFLGNDLSRFDRIFTIKQMPEVENFLSERVGREVSIPRLQTGGAKMTLDMLTKEAFEKLYLFCESDYDLVKDYIPRPEAQPVRSGGLLGYVAGKLPLRW